MLFADEVLDFFAGEGLEVFAGLDCAEADEALGEEFAGADFEFLDFHGGHALDDALALADVGALVGADEVADEGYCGIVAGDGVFDEAAYGFQYADFAEEVNLGHGVLGFHGAAAGAGSEAVRQLEGVVTNHLQYAVAHLSVACLIPCDAGEVVLGLEVLEAHVPDECAEGLDGIDFVALGADEAEPFILVGIGGVAGLAVGDVVVAGI